jgi:hypothetical protein
VQTNTRYALGSPVEPILDTLPETVTRRMAFDLLERVDLPAGDMIQR